MDNNTFPLQTFHAHKKYWLGWFVITFLAAFMLMLIGGNLFNRMVEATNNGVILLIIFMAILMIVAFASNHKTTWPFPWKIKFTVSETAVSGFNGTTQLNVNWDNLIFLHYEIQKNTHWLFLATQEEDINFSLDHLPATAVWQALKQRANPAILIDSGYQKVNERDEIKAQEIVENIELPLVIKPNRFFQWAFILCSIFFFGMVVLCWQQELLGGAIFFLVPTLIGIYYFLRSGPVIFDETSIHYQPWKRHYQIQWNDITQIGADQQGSAIVFQGTQQQLVIPGFRIYQQQDSTLMAHFLDVQINQRQLPLQRTWKAMFKKQKNTKVRS